MHRVRCIGADARSCFPTHGGRAARPEPKAPCLHISALTVARPHYAPSNRLCAGATHAAHEADGRPCKCALAQISAPHAYHTPVLNRSSLRAGIGPPELLRIPLPHALLETGRRPSASHEAREKSCLIITLSLCEPADHKTRAVTATSTQAGTLLMRLRAIARAEEVHAAPALLSCSSVRD